MGFFKKHKKLIIYTICGVAAFLVDMICYWVLYNKIFSSIFDGGLLTWSSNIVSETITIVFAYVTNKIFVFKSRSFKPKVLLLEGGSFAIARLGTLLLNAGLMYFFVNILMLEQFNLYIKVLVTAIIVVLNYFLSEFIVFRQKHVSHFAKILFTEGIEYYACIPLSSCKVTKKYLLTKNELDDDSTVVTMLLPYRTKQKSENLSAYASVKDYHALVDSLSDKLESYIFKKYPSAKFKVFADHSPIDEVHAACVSGLGFMGDNGLLINERYSSFVFVAECITSLTPKELGLTFADEEELSTCLHCGKCAAACPSKCISIGENGENTSNKKECLSAITQKKGELTEDEKNMILESGCIWGCDVCQNSCPYTKNAKYTPIKFFNEDVITRLDTETLSNLSKEQFKLRPFAWRGKETIQRNVLLWEEFQSSKAIEPEDPKTEEQPKENE